MNASRRIEVFFYGLFMDVELLGSKGAKPQNVRVASVPGYSLRIGQRATLVPATQGRAYGMLMQLTHPEIEQLYAEASVCVYQPEAVIAKLGDGSEVAALCFNLPAAPRPEEANPEYAGKLRDLARRLGFPPDYVEEIR
jgi:hypothetical protein